MVQLTRRSFVAKTGLGPGSSLSAGPTIVRGQKLNRKIHLAGIGVGGKGSSEVVENATAIILPGCIVQRLGGGRPMDWDGPNMKSTHLAEASQWVKRACRSGWEP